MSLNRIALILLFFFSAFCGLSQRVHLNQAYFLTSYNPAFTTSVIEFNRASVFYGGNESIGLMANLNIDALYSGIGIYAERNAQNAYFASVNYAYHTLVSRENHHLMGGLSLQIQQIPGLTRLSPRVGLLFNHEKPRRLFVGLSAFKGEWKTLQPDSITFSGWSIQAGSQRFISRMLTLSLLGILEYSKDDSGKEELWSASFLPMLWYMKYSAGAGWRTNDFVHNELLLRAMYAWKIDVSLTCILNHRSINRLIKQPEISLRYLF
jgi:hypothetical protein